MNAAFETGAGGVPIAETAAGEMTLLDQFLKRSTSNFFRLWAGRSGSTVYDMHAAANQVQRRSFELGEKR